MTQEEKQLLLKDLCARLPYGVKGPHREQVHSITIINTSGLYPSLQVDNYDAWFPIETFKPYLRPMSSMTEEEVTELAYKVFQQPDIDIIRRWVFENKSYPSIDGNPVMVIDWLIAHHFDYRGLIEKGLAIEVKEGMYELKKK